MSQVFPKEIIANTVEVHLFKNKVKTKIIYTILLLSLIGVFVAMPFIYMDIYTASSGIIKPEKERHQIISLYSGIIKKINLKENQVISIGDTLVMVDNSVAQEKLALSKEKKIETQENIHDLTYLVQHKKVVLDSLQRFTYQKDYLQYRQKLSELSTRHKKNRRDFIRQKKLYNKQVIPKVEYLDSKYSLDLIVNEIAYFKKQQTDQWQAELTQQITYKKELKSAIAQTEIELKQYTLVAPIKGTIQNLTGITKGSIITAGSPICEISPNSNLIAECYVSPADIGLIVKNNPIKFQISSYNYHQWGMATGRVVEIGKDVLMLNETPVFKVICSLDQKELSLKSGVKGKLKKGMTLQAQFFIANRSVFELLYDKVDDWFNPATQR